MLIPREGEGGEGGEGGGFWQSIVNYFGCGGEEGLRRIIPPTIDTMTRYPDREAEKVGETDKKDKVEQIDPFPSKPYYFVLPPALGPHYYYNNQNPQSNFLQANFLPKNQNNPFASTFETKSHIMPQNVNSVTNVDVKPNGFETKTNAK